jgi:hypothetical protein
MTNQIPTQPSASQPAGGPDAPGGTPYPDIAGTSHATAAAAVELSQDGKITKFTVVWDGSLLDDRAITALAAGAVDR